MTQVTLATSRHQRRLGASLCSYTFQLVIMRAHALPFVHVSMDLWTLQSLPQVCVCRCYVGAVGWIRPKHLPTTWWLLDGRIGHLLPVIVDAWLLHIQAEWG